VTIDQYEHERAYDRHAGAVYVDPSRPRAKMTAADSHPPDDLDDLRAARGFAVAFALSTPVWLLLAVWWMS
jgi:hypothetical protein